MSTYCYVIYIINSVLLLRLLALSALIMLSFSVRQRLHRLEILV